MKTITTLIRISILAFFTIILGCKEESTPKKSIAIPKKVSETSFSNEKLVECIQDQICIDEIQRRLDSAFLADGKSHQYLHKNFKKINREQHSKLIENLINNPTIMIQRIQTLQNSNSCPKDSSKNEFYSLTHLITNSKDLKIKQEYFKNADTKSLCLDASSNAQIYYNDAFNNGIIDSIKWKKLKTKIFDKMVLSDSVDGAYYPAQFQKFYQAKFRKKKNNHLEIILYANALKFFARGGGKLKEQQIYVIAALFNPRTALLFRQYPVIDRISIKFRTVSRYHTDVGAIHSSITRDNYKKLYNGKLGEKMMNNNLLEWAPAGLNYDWSLFRVQRWCKEHNVKCKINGF